MLKFTGLWWLVVYYCYCFYCCYCCPFMYFPILFPSSFSAGAFIVLLYIAINDLVSLSSPTGDLCSLTPSVISLSQVTNERDFEHSACLSQVLLIHPPGSTWRILAASTFLLLSLSCTNEPPEADHRIITVSYLLSLKTRKITHPHKDRNNSLCVLIY